MVHTCCIFECAIIAGKSPPSFWLLLTTLHLLFAKAVVILIQPPHLRAPGRVGEAVVTGWRGEQWPFRHLAEVKNITWIGQTLGKSHMEEMVNAYFAYLSFSLTVTGSTRIKPSYRQSARAEPRKRGRSGDQPQDGTPEGTSGNGVQHGLAKYSSHPQTVS